MERNPLGLNGRHRAPRRTLRKALVLYLHRGQSYNRQGLPTRPLDAASSATAMEVDALDRNGKGKGKGDKGNGSFRWQEPVLRLTQDGF